MARRSPEQTSDRRAIRTPPRSRGRGGVGSESAKANPLRASREVVLSAARRTSTGRISIAKSAKANPLFPSRDHSIDETKPNSRGKSGVPKKPRHRGESWRPGRHPLPNGTPVASKRATAAPSGLPREVEDAGEWGAKLQKQTHFEHREKWS